MRKYKQVKNNRITLRFSNDRFDEIEGRARAGNLTCTVYLQDLINNALLSTTTATPNDALEIYRAYLLWYQELRKQGNSLDRLTNVINAANLDDRTIDTTAYLQVLSTIAHVNREIAAAIAKLEPRF
jgi:hypothetical protein